MIPKLATIALLTAALATAPVSPASAHGWGHHHGGGGGLIAGIVGAGVGLTVAAATIATAPIRAVAAAVPCAPAPVYYAAPCPAPVYYAAQVPAYGYPPYGYVPYAYAQPVYAYPPGYGG